MTVELPYPPTTNHAYTCSRGRKVKTLRARQYAEQVGYAMLPHRGQALAFDGERLRVKIRTHAPDRRRRDLANIEKLAVDAVFKALGLDDEQIDVLTLVRGDVDRQRPRLEFRVETLPRTTGGG